MASRRFLAVAALDEGQARNVVAGVAVVVAACLAALVWGAGAVLVVLVVGQAYLLFTRANLASYAIETRDETDRAHEKADTALATARAVVEHLTGAEPPSTGRHGAPTGTAQ
jgi:fatty acid desaturase